MIQPLQTVPALEGALCPAAPATRLGELGCLLAGQEALLLVLLLGLAAAWVFLRRRAAPGEADTVLLVFPVGNSAPARAAGRRSRGVRAEGATRVRARGEADAPEAGSRAAGLDDAPAASAPPAPGAHPTPEASPAAPAAQGSARPSRAAAPAPPRPVGAGSAAAAHAHAEEPVEGTLQLLPGRLEIRSGPGEGGEVRFVRVPGTEPEVTFGRSDGSPYRHVQLPSPTVSRLHARLRFQDGRWHLSNESATNPTVLNGRPIDASTESPRLHDGDVIEMGEVAFLFHQPEGADRLPHRSSWYTDRGRRATNQDAIAVRTLRDRREVAVVCDGMGAQAAGELASHQALDALLKSLEEGADLPAAVQAANRAVRAEVGADPQRAGMGTTLVALLRDGDEYRIANVGDSRAYRLDDVGLRQITEDHSFVAEAVREGRMSHEEASRSPWRNAVTRHLGADDEIPVDLHGPYSAREAHLVLLCSDGAHGVLSAERIEELARAAGSVRDVARELGEAVLQAGGEDNVTVAAVEFGAPAHPGSRNGS